MWPRTIQIGAGVMLAFMVVIWPDLPWWIGWPGFCFGVFLIVLGFAPRWTQARIAQLPGGNFIVLIIQKISADSDTVGGLSQEEKVSVRSRFSRLNEDQRAALKRILQEGHGRNIPDPIWGPLENLGLVERDYVNKQGIKKEYRPYIRRLLEER